MSEKRIEFFKNFIREQERIKELSVLEAHNNQNTQTASEKMMTAKAEKHPSLKGVRHVRSEGRVHVFLLPPDKNSPSHHRYVIGIHGGEGEKPIIFHDHIIPIDRNKESPEHVKEAVKESGIIEKIQKNSEISNKEIIGPAFRAHKQIIDESNLQQPRNNDPRTEVPSTMGKFFG